MRIVGNDGRHVLFDVEESGKYKRVIGFGLAEKAGTIQIGDRIDLVVELGINTWNGEQEIQLKMKDFRKIGEKEVRKSGARN